MEKQCTYCRALKEEEQYPLKRGKRIGVCTECYKSHYGNPAAIDERLRSRARKQDIRRATKCRAYIKELLTNSSCVDCGYNDWRALEFDHRVPEEKSKSITDMIAAGTMKAMLQEIEKCDIVCCNCHRIRTIAMFPHWRK